jgi:hypothetical protein
MEPGSPDDLPDRVPWDKIVGTDGTRLLEPEARRDQTALLAAWSARWPIPMMTSVPTFSGQVPPIVSRRTTVVTKTDSWPRLFALASGQRAVDEP